MAYYINLFSPETYFAFAESDRTVSGFRCHQRPSAMALKPGDKLICYMTKLSRWIGVLEVRSEWFEDQTPIFMPVDDPFTERVRVACKTWLKPEYGIPISADICWDHLSFTRELPKNALTWTAMVRGSLRRLEEEDGIYLETILTNQETAPKCYELSPADEKKLRLSVINSTEGRQISVTVPADEHDEAAIEPQGSSEQRESIEIQATLAEIGERLGLKVWLPVNDRSRVLQLWHPRDEKTILKKLPLNYDDVTLQTIENIDVLWIRRHSVVRAFEVEHTTSIYSGILRMADLMALQPNLSIQAHIVAPLGRRSKVLQEITRPVFALLEKGALSGYCTYLSYDSVRELCQETNLEYMKENIVDKYAEYAEDTELA